ncbi:MAG TPA: response regulator [Caulobacteraceae bacterium]|nr:response regulator [Caulobacteraceae bacterium]
MTAFRPRILVVDDEPQIHRFLTPALEAAGYEAVRVDDGAAALREIARKPPDAVVLDLGLPDIDGKDVLSKARAFYDGPIVVLSARERETEKIDALDLGADDYLEKPFGVGELLARLRAALRHRMRRDGAGPVIEAGDLIVDLDRRRVSKAGEAVKLSPKEYDLLAHLAQGGGRVVTHRQLLTAVWGPAHADDVQYLRVVVSQVRAKIEADPAAPRLLLTEAGVGYRFGG